MRSAIHAHTVHSFPAPPPFHGSSAHLAPRARVRPRAPRGCPGGTLLRGEPRNQPRLRGAGAGGEPGWGRGAGAPCGKPGGAGEPRPRRLRARSASAGRAAAGSGGGRGPGAMWTGGRRPGRLRRAVSTCEPGGRGTAPARWRGGATHAAGRALHGDPGAGPGAPGQPARLPPSPRRPLPCRCAWAPPATLRGREQRPARGEAGI